MDCLWGHRRFDGKSEEKMSRRSSNIELLRIIGMLMIVAYHYVIHGVLQGLWGGRVVYWDKGTAINQILCSMMLPGGAVGICIFFLITGYFQIKRNKFSLKKLLCEIHFYAMIVVMLGIICVLCSIDTEEGACLVYIFKAIGTPITANLWWFATSYILLMFLSPYLNQLFSRLNKKGACAVIFIAWLSTQISIGLTYEYNMLVLPVFYYFLGAFMRKFSKNGYGRRGAKVIAALLLWVMISALWYIKYAVGFEYTIMHVATNGLLIQTLQYAILIPLCGIAILKLFLTFNFYSSMVNKLGSLTFGIYLLHDSGIARQLIWNNILKVGNQYLTDYFIIYALFSIVAVYVICSLFDLGRQAFIERWQYWLVNYIERYCEEHFVNQTEQGEG